MGGKSTSAENRSSKDRGNFLIDGCIYLLISVSLLVILIGMKQ